MNKGKIKLKLILFRWKGEVTSSTYVDFTHLLWRADYHGAYVKVSRSTCPSLVGIEGILVFETRNTVKLLGKDNETRCKYIIL